MSYRIGQIQVLDNDKNGRFDPDRDQILGENDEELHPDDWKVKETLGQIGMRHLQDLPLDTASEIHQHYSRLISTEKVLNAQPTFLQKHLDTWRREVSIQISNLKEYARLQIGMRAYCTLPETVATFFTAIQGKVSELKKGPLGFSIYFPMSQDFESLYDQAISNGLESFFVKAGAAAQMGEVDETQELLYQAYDFALDHGWEYDETREAKILEYAEGKQAWLENELRQRTYEMAERLFKQWGFIPYERAVNPNWKLDRKKLLEHFEHQRRQFPK